MRLREFFLTDGRLWAPANAYLNMEPPPAVYAKGTLCRIRSFQNLKLFKDQYTGCLHSIEQAKKHSVAQLATVAEQAAGYDARRQLTVDMGSSRLSQRHCYYCV
jgi:hypothetical protein